MCSDKNLYSVFAVFLNAMKKQKFVLRNYLIPKGNTYRQKVCKSNHYLSITKYLLIKTLSLFLKEKGFLYID